MDLNPRRERAPRTSVIIPSFNYAQYLAAAIDSVLGQTDGDFELLVVDDGSTDSSRALVQAYSDRRVRLLVQPHRGRGAARNTGLRAARGRYIAFLDADDLWAPDKLTRQCAVLLSRPEIGLVYSRYGVIDADGRITSNGASYLSAKPSGAILKHLLTGNVIGTPSTVCFRRELISEKKLFVDETHTYREDWHFFIRLAEQTRVDYVPCTLAYHRQHDRNAQGNVAATRDQSLQTAEFGLRLARKNFGLTEYELQRLRQQVLGYIETTAGREFVKAGDWDKARAYAARSVRHYPWSIAEWALLLMASVGWMPNALRQRLK